VVPTLNLRTAQELLPQTGVYATEVSVRDCKYRAVANVGMRPTFDGKALTVESYLFEFDELVTAGPMEVWFWERLRDEMKYSGPEALRTQIGIDAGRARRFFRLLDRSGLKRQSA
jgi:riboflavin kinase/FMN adenylyltransferase